MLRGITYLLFFFCFQVHAQSNLQPPGATNESCMDVVKNYLSSTDYGSSEALDKIRSACIEVESRCVQIVGDSLSSSERRDANAFLPLVRRCAGRGKADCLNSVFDSTPSFDRSTVAQASNLMKKCEASRQ